MVKRLSFIAVLLLTLYGHGQSIAVTGVSSNPVCTGTTVTVTFSTTNGNGQPSRYDAQSTFTAYLSSVGGAAPYTSLGAFTPTYTFVGNNNAVNSGVTTTITLPAGTAVGNYRISIGSASPTFNGANGAGASSVFAVSAGAFAGAVSANQSICAGSQPANISIGASTGSIQWQSSVNNVSFGNIAGQTTNVLSGAVLGALSATRYYRAVVTNGSCATRSEVVTVSVDPASVGGILSGDATVCSNSNSGSINLSGYTGNITRWEYSTDGGATWINSNNTTASESYLNLTQTRLYRARIQNGSCIAAYSSIATITVSPATAGGNVSNNATVCSSGNSGTLNLSGHVGNVVRWEYSTDGGATWINITNTTASQSYLNLTQTRMYRARVQSGGCPAAYSSVATITVTPASVGGSVFGGITFCSLGSGSLLLSGHVGNIVRWQSADDADFTEGVLNIPNNTTTLNYVNVASTTYYRAVVTSGVCGQVFSAVAGVIVTPAIVGGSVTGSATVCNGNNSGILTLSGHNGTIVGWESSADNFATAGTPIANNTTTLNYSNLATTTSYRAIIGNGICSATVSGAATITVDNATQWIGTASSSWNDPANWSCGIVPTTALDVTITAVTNQPVISDAATAHSITMETGTSLTVQSDAVLTVIDVINAQESAVLTLENDASLIQVNDVANTGNAVVKRNSNPLKRLDYILWSSPVSGQNLLAFSPLTVASRFYTYNPSTDLYNAITPSANNFAKGVGYLIRMPDNHPASATIWNGTFSGTLNNGAVNIDVTANTYNAIGNPYPSAIDADAFIVQNNLTEALYFWRKTNNDTTTSYATYTLAGGVGTKSNTGGDQMLLTPDGIIQPGQGFIAKSTSGVLSFNNAMRTGVNGQFFRQNVERNRIWLNLTNAQGVFSQTMISYMTGATNEVDAAIDGLYFNDSQLALTSMIGQTEYAIQGRALPFVQSDVVPLGLQTIVAGSYSIAIDHLDGLFADESQGIMLKDNLDGSVHDLKSGVYTFAAGAGTFNNRFEIVYQPLLSTSTMQFDASQVVVYQQDQEIVIDSGKTAMKSVQVFDTRGRLLTSQDNINASQTRLRTNMTNQVLIVKIVSKDGTQTTRKIIN